MSFFLEITPTDLLRLREIVKRVHLANYPKHMITDYEADKLIESFGPQVAEALIKDAVDRGQVK